MSFGSTFTQAVRQPLRLLLAAGVLTGNVLAAQAQEFSHDITLSDIMASIVMPAANVLWEAAYPESTPEGEVIKGPESEEAWQKVHEAAISLAASTNLLLIPDLPVVDPALVRETPAGELTPKVIGELIKSQNAAWAAHAMAMHTVAIQALIAVDGRDLNTLYEITGGLDAPCTSCHQQFWYPE